MLALLALVACKGGDATDSGTDGGTEGAPPPPIVDVLAAEAIQARLEQLVAQGGDRLATGAGEAAARDLLSAELSAMGWTVQPQTFSWGVPLRTATNLVAELPGQTDEVVLLGAHLDTVRGGPGLNDNGTGVATLLALAEVLAAEERTRPRTVRLAFWTWAEGGYVGSYRYLQALSPDEAARHVAYLDVDALGGLNGVRYLADTDGSQGGFAGAAASAEVEALLAAWLDAQGQAWEPLPVEWTTDLVYFLDSGIPAAGISAGTVQVKTEEQAATFGGTAGAPMDACARAACDDLDNVDLDRTLELALAVGSALDTLAAGPP